MSTRDSGFGGDGGRSSEFESDFANRQNAVATPGGTSWGASTANQKSEVSPMAQGAGRPGQPNFGQNSIFGNGGSAFTQMPTYTPTTRGPGEQPQAAPQAPYPPQAQPQQPAAPQQRPQAAPQQPAAARPEPSYQQPQGQPQQAYGGNQHYQPQAYNAPAQSFSDQDLPDLSNADPAFPDSIFGDFKPDASFDTDFSDQGTADQAAHDASFPEEGDTGFPEMDAQDPAYAAEPQYAPQSHAPAQQHAHAQAPQYHPQSYAPQPQAPAAQPQQRGQSHGQVPPGDPGRQLQAYDNAYDQPPQIALAGGQPPVPQGQDYYETDRGDADFIDESQIAPPAGARSKLAQTLKGRSAFMVASALLGAIALGGALAFAYKQSGGGISSDTPMVTADNRPVKEAPDSPGGKEFPHKNKLIYDRLTNGDTPESERLVPRQEDVAVPALPPASATAGLPGAVATTDMTTQSVDGGEEGGPRKVKTMVVRPDGSVEAPAVAEAADAAAGAVAGAADAAAAQAAQAAGQTANMMPVPIPDGPVPMAAPAAPAAAPQQVAAAAPAAAAAAAAPSKYVVQVGAHKSQTEALAIYADIQQKNPKLLGNYPPLVQKASVGGGTMYRLRVGPIADKSEAYKLCGELKTQGTDCFVAVQ
jgi:cell division septation protein DedD